MLFHHFVLLNGGFFDGDVRPIGGVKCWHGALAFDHLTELGIDYLMFLLGLCERTGGDSLHTAPSTPEDCVPQEVPVVGCKDKFKAAIVAATTPEDLESRHHRPLVYRLYLKREALPCGSFLSIYAIEDCVSISSLRLGEAEALGVGLVISIS